MADFHLAIPTLLRHEGGYVNDPDDCGGVTNFGICQRSYPKLDIASLTLDEAKAMESMRLAKEALANQFKALADEILERKTKSFSESSQEKLGTLLTPLKLQIEDFRKKVEEAQSDSKTGVTKLETLVGDLSGLNQKLSQEAHNLTTALVGSSSDQGKWGEEVA